MFIVRFSDASGRFRYDLHGAGPTMFSTYAKAEAYAMDRAAEFRGTRLAIHEVIKTPVRVLQFPI